jgi:hypothetical protein
MPVIVGTSILFILPDSIRVVSSLLFSSCPKDCIFKLDEMARNARNTIERVLVATVEKVVILRHMVDMKEDGWFQYLEDSSFINRRKNYD